MTGQLMVIGRTVWGPQVPTLKGTETSLSYVQCFLSLLSSSINVSNFHITRWTPPGQTSHPLLTMDINIYPLFQWQTLFSVAKV